MNDDFIRMEARVRILNEQIHELKTNGPTPQLAARVYRSLLEADPPMLQEAEETRAFLHAETDAGNPVTAEVLDLLSDDPFWTDEEGP